MEIRIDRTIILILILVKFSIFFDAKLKLLTHTQQNSLVMINLFPTPSPNLIPYPENMTHHAVSIVKTQQDEYVRIK